jgi:hypothetical protein
VKEIEPMISAIIAPRSRWRGEAPRRRFPQTRRPSRTSQPTRPATATTEHQKRSCVQQAAIAAERMSPAPAALPRARVRRDSGGFPDRRVWTRVGRADLCLVGQERRHLAAMDVSDDD